MKQLKILVLSSMILFSTYANTNTVNITPVISYLLSDSNTGLKLLLSGKTFYHDKGDVDDYLGSFTFNVDVTSVTITNLDGPNMGDSSVQVTRVDDNTLYIGEGSIELTGETSDYLLFGETRFYFEQTKAEAYFSSLEALIVGHTYYVTANNHVETLFFGTDGKLHDTWMEEGTLQEVVMDYSIDVDVLSIVTPDGNTITFENVVQTADWLEFSSPDGSESGRFFYDYATAEASLPVAVYEIDGITLANDGWNNSALLSPNGGENWYNDTNVSTIWENGSITGTTVDFFILWDDPTNILDVMNTSTDDEMTNILVSKNWGHFAYDIPNTGSYSFNPEILYSTGDAYMILIISSNGDWDISDSTFSVNQ